MVRFIIVCSVNGLVFGTLDGIINANPFAQKLYTVFSPVARTSINVPAGIIIDLIYGFVMGYIYLLLYTALPGSNGMIKGLSFACIVWFFRVLMGGITNWMMFTVPASALVYSVAAGLIEMLIIGIVYGAFIRPLR